MVFKLFLHLKKTTNNGVCTGSSIYICPFFDDLPFLSHLTQKKVIQWSLDLVTIDLVTILDLVTLLPLTTSLCSKIHRFNDNLANFIVLI